MLQIIRLWVCKFKGHRFAINVSAIEPDGTMIMQKFCQRCRQSTELRESEVPQLILDIIRSAAASAFHDRHVH